MVYVLSVGANCTPVGEGVTSSDVILIISVSFKITRLVQNSFYVAAERDVNVTKIKPYHDKRYLCQIILSRDVQEMVIMSAK